MDYGKKPKRSFTVRSCPQVATAVELYNTVLCIHSLRQHTDVAITYGNGALLDICRSNLDIIRWTMARSRKYAADQLKFWKNIKLERNNVDAQYIYIGVKAFNYFMPRETLSLKGPGGGGLIHMNSTCRS